MKSWWILVAAVACTTREPRARPRPAPAPSTESAAPAAEVVQVGPCALDAIGSGTSCWVETMPNQPDFALINARVDVGTLHGVGDAIEFTTQWPSQPGHIDLVRRRGVEVPDGSYGVDVERVLCRPDGPVDWPVESKTFAPDGRVVDVHPWDPEAERREAESEERTIGYSGGRSSLVCWALARKCDRRALSWPPPPNQAPLDNSDRAVQMRRDYDAMFTPTCPDPLTRE